MHVLMNTHLIYCSLIVLGAGIGMAIGILMGIEIQRAREEDK
jgi:hypothetical protein